MHRFLLLLLSVPELNLVSKEGKNISLNCDAATDSGKQRGEQKSSSIFDTKKNLRKNDDWSRDAATNGYCVLTYFSSSQLPMKKIETIFHN